MDNCVGCFRIVDDVVRSCHESVSAGREDDGHRYPENVFSSSVDHKAEDRAGRERHGVNRRVRCS